RFDCDWSSDVCSSDLHPSLVPSQLFPTADGYIVVMCNKEKFFPALCEKLGRPELAADPRFRSFADRLEHRDELIPLLKDAFRTRSEERRVGKECTSWR